MTIITGTLALNLTLHTVVMNRQTLPVARPLPVDQVIENCLLGLPYGYAGYIGRNVLFLPARGGRFKMLVVDVESVIDQPHMDENNLAADTNCVRFVHWFGKIRNLETRH